MSGAKDGADEAKERDDVRDDLQQEVHEHLAELQELLEDPKSRARSLANGDIDLGELLSYHDALIKACEKFALTEELELLAEMREHPVQWLRE
ncbi:hypothetical protein [Lacipirellula sp.]|uniref:hypothetical protein n=1 Tax=Lacipirellula sp. TaxID=2691419 RepID=UPI003D0E6E21